MTDSLKDGGEGSADRYQHYRAIERAELTIRLAQSAGIFLSHERAGEVARLAGSNVEALRKAFTPEPLSVVPAAFASASREPADD